MPILYPESRQQVIDRIKSDIRNELKDIDPFIRNTVLSALAIGFGGGIYDLNINQKSLQTELFPDSASDDFAEKWGTFKNIIPISARPAKGMISITGQNGSLIPDDTTFATVDGILYELDATYHDDLAITERVNVVESIILNGQTAIVTTKNDHQYATSDVVTITGSDQQEYNIAAQILVINSKMFSYSIVGYPATPATGAMKTSCYNCYSHIICKSGGTKTNRATGAELYCSKYITGINSAVHVGYYGLNGGTDDEDSKSYRDRYLYVYRNPISNFNVADITLRCKSLLYVDRVWVLPTTPEPGQVTIYFTVVPTDGSFNIIPSAGQVIEVKNNLLAEPSIVPAPVDYDNDVIVKAPSPVKVDFIFSQVDPNDEHMQAAIINNLRQELAENTEISSDFTAHAYNAAIYQSVSTLTGDKVKSFHLSLPAGDISIAAGELAVLGTVSFPAH